jgi:hypothetical protein
MATGPKVVPLTKSDTPENFSGPEFLTRIDLVQHAKIIFPLSAETAGLLAGYSASEDSNITEQSLIAFLGNPLYNSPKLWEGYARGVVVKCNQNILVNSRRETKITPSTPSWNTLLRMPLIFLLQGRMAS